jgi:hypothetical protein
MPDAADIVVARARARRHPVCHHQLAVRLAVRVRLGRAAVHRQGGHRQQRYHGAAVADQHPAPGAAGRPACPRRRRLPRADARESPEGTALMRLLWRHGQGCGCPVNVRGPACSRGVHPFTIVPLTCSLRRVVRSTAAQAVPARARPRGLALDLARPRRRCSAFG